MKTTLAKAIAIMIVVTSIAATTYALDPNTPTPTITFKNAEPVGWNYYFYASSRMSVLKNMPTPTHAVTIDIDSYYLIDSVAHRSTYRRHPDHPRRSVVEAVLKTEMSEDLRLLISSGFFGTLLSDTPGTFRLYAFSEDEAKALTHAVVNACTQSASKYTKDNILQRDVLIKQISELKENIASIDKDLISNRSLTAEFAKSAYITSLDQASQTVMKMNEQLNLLTIEVAGLQAKLQEIDRRREVIKKTISMPSRKLSPAVLQSWTNLLAHVEELYVDLMIEFRSAEARQQSIDKIRARAWKYCQLKDKWVQLINTKSSEDNSLKRKKNDLQKAEGYIVKPQPYMNPPVLNGTVKIHKILGACQVGSDNPLTDKYLPAHPSVRGLPSIRWL